MKTGKCIVAGAMIILSSITALPQTGDSSKKVSVPVRIGILPGLSTQGAADRYTTSKFSVNLWGGMTGNVEGAEVAGLFNIDKGNVQHVQAAGWFNMVSGSVKGVQSAGLYNKVNGHANGVQAAGIVNLTGKNVHGMQAGGIYNHAGGTLSGIQAAGIGNFAGHNAKGLQAAGITNISNKRMQGLQVAGILNYARHVKGLQVGLINIADTSEGFSLGLINIVKKGYYKLFLSANEVMDANLAIKTGNPKMYNILMVGFNPGSDNKVFSFGWGIGREIAMGKRFAINPEITSQYVYLGDWDYANFLSKFQLLLYVRLANGIALTGGPSFAVYYSDQTEPEKGYKFRIPSSGYQTFELWNNNVTGWIGWNAGISLF